jgi:hypothetical protein
MTRDEVIRIAREAGIGDITLSVWTDTLAQFAALVAAAEREACAKVCEDAAHPESGSKLAWASRACAAAIRARGEK